jgi:protocatechuate 3,4-dioxygenase beta subunit
LAQAFDGFAGIGVALAREMVYFPKKLDRREALAALGAGVGAAAIAACSGSPAAADSTTTTTTTTNNSTCAVSPTETRGPYPDSVGMINNSAFYRRDITEGKSGLPLTLTLTVVNVNSACAPVSNVQVEIWQCDASGNYSEYSQPGFNGAGQTFLRGVQTTDANGQVTFTTIYPGWYAGRATHIHVDVYRSGTIVKSTQIAFPEDVTRAVYGSGVYASKGQSSTSNAGDMVFADSLADELATITGGSTASGYTATFRVGISV